MFGKMKKHLKGDETYNYNMLPSAYLPLLFN